MKLPRYNDLVDQPINRSINKSIDQSINQLIKSTVNLKLTLLINRFWDSLEYDKWQSQWNIKIAKYKQLIPIP